MKENNDAKQQEVHSSGSNKSYWVDSVTPLELKSLSNNLKTEVIIVGAGISGLSIAYSLCKSGRQVTVIDDGFIGSGETGRTSAHLVTALDDRYYELDRIYGKDGSALAAQSHGAAIDFIESAVMEEQINCGFNRVDGYLFLHPSDEIDNLEKEYNAALRAGVKVDLLTGVPGMKLKEESRCIRFTNQAIFHPMKYLQGIAGAIIRKGGNIYTQTKAIEIDHTGVQTEAGNRIDADHVVVATNSPVNDKYAIHLKQFPYRTYIVASLVKKNTLPNALWWDTGDHNLNKNVPPYHYVRLTSYNDTHDLLICGGEDHPTGLKGAQNISPDKHYDKVEQWMRDNFPVEETIYKWSGQVLETMDSLAFIGRNPFDKENVYIVTGDSGNGLTHGTIAGILIPDLIMGKKNEWEDLYKPSRFKFFKTGKTWVQEFGGGLIKYIKEKTKAEDAAAVRRLAKGDATIIKLDGSQFGAYRDEQDVLHIVSAECTHLNCIVKWNSDEKSWDCPCHGSRFSYEGKVLNGPAIEDLMHYDEKNSELFL